MNLPKNGSKYIYQKLIKMQGKMDAQAIKFGDFNTSLSENDKAERKTIRIQLTSEAM